MAKFIVELFLDGYESEEEMKEACQQFIFDQLNCSASYVRTTPVSEDSIESQLSESDRFLGKTIRHLEFVSDALASSDRSRTKMKREAGYDDSVSFDVVWKEVLEKAKKNTT